LLLTLDRKPVEQIAVLRVVVMRGLPVSGQRFGPRGARDGVDPCRRVMNGLGLG